MSLIDLLLINDDNVFEHLLLLGHAGQLMILFLSFWISFIRLSLKAWGTLNMIVYSSYTCFIWLCLDSFEFCRALSSLLKGSWLSCKWQNAFVILFLLLLYNLLACMRIYFFRISRTLGSLWIRCCTSFGSKEAILREFWCWSFLYWSHFEMTCWNNSLFWYYVGTKIGCALVFRTVFDVRAIHRWPQ